MSAPRCRSRSGFSLLELLGALVVLGVLAGIAVPNFRAAVYRADATKIVTDMTAVRLAVFELREESGRLPRRARWGSIPPELVPYLDNVSFTYKDLQYRLTTNTRRGRVDFLVRYPRNSPIGNALQRFRRPGKDSGSVTWSRRRTRFRLLEGNR
jgi:prepilin-type N-terminal cleavage/methylation domain-containing protein